MKLHTKLGKPIPSSEPTVVSNTSSTTSTVKTNTTAAAKIGTAKTTVVTTTAKKVVAAPKINFVGSYALNYFKGRRGWCVNAYINQVNSKLSKLIWSMTIKFDKISDIW